MTHVVQKGGIQKFLYTSGKGEAEEEQLTFTPKTSASNPVSGLEVNLDKVWSIQKNVRPAKLTSPDRLNHNVNKGYYSRHGAMKDGGRGAKPPGKAELGAAWGSGSSRGAMAPSFTASPSGPVTSRSDEGPHSTGTRTSGGPAGPLDD